MQMTKKFFLASVLAAALLSSACNDEQSSESAAESGGAEETTGSSAAGKPVTPPAVTFKAGTEPVSTAKVGGPVTIAYRIIGQPVIGQPLSIDLRVSSVLGEQPVRLDYRILDASALQLAEAQTPYATIAPSAGSDQGQQQVSVIPLREGRLFLNVAASVETADGSVSTVTAIPIQVGDVGRELRENGRLETNGDGESVRVLGGSEN